MRSDVVARRQHNAQSQMHRRTIKRSVEQSRLYGVRTAQGCGIELARMTAQPQPLCRPLYHDLGIDRSLGLLS